MSIKEYDGMTYWVNDRGVVLIGKGADLLKDEVLGKLLKVAFDLYPTIDVATVDAETNGNAGGIKATFSVFLSADEIAALPSIYDEKPTKRGKK